jgi:carboxyl-terminal processing protease
MNSHAPSPPFGPGETVAVILPSPADGLAEAEARQLANIPVIFEENRRAIERELGAPFRFVERDPGHGPRWLIGPRGCNPDLARAFAGGEEGPVLALDRRARLLVCDAPTPAGVWETFSLLRSLARFEGGLLRVADCANAGEATERIVEEVGDSYPAFGLRGLDWAEVCARHVPLVAASDDPPAAMQEWMAELGDGHTWVRPAVPLGDLPYEAWVTEGSAVLTRVPAGTRAWEAGARPGFRLVGADAAGWRRRTAATPHSRPLVAGRRLLAGPVGVERELVAESPAGARVTWREAPPADPWEPVAAWRRLPSGAGYLQVRAWLKGGALEAVVDEAFEAIRRAGRLVVDLRGNPGGDLVLAHRFRDRFLRGPATMGSIRYSVSHSVLSEPEPILAEPAPAEKRWAGRVRFLTDPLTYSSSEDLLLGLQGLEHVEVIGEPSGGGSGRMRVLRLLPGWRLTVSTALTYDRAGRCVEGAGIPVDRPVAPDRFSDDGTDPVLAEADRNW